MHCLRQHVTILQITATPMDYGFLVHYKVAREESIKAEFFIVHLVSSLVICESVKVVCDHQPRTSC